jgi:hypothetical protein
MSVLEVMVGYEQAEYENIRFPDHRLIKYGIRSPEFIWAPVYSCTHWLRPRKTTFLCEPLHKMHQTPHRIYNILHIKK